MSASSEERLVRALARVSGLEKEGYTSSTIVVAALHALSTGLLEAWEDDPNVIGPMLRRMVVELERVDGFSLTISMN